MRALDEAGVPAVAIARSEPSARESIFADPFAEYLHAPVEPEPLCRAVARLVGRGRRS
jgi:CheY-like chemotaxis protein